MIETTIDGAILGCMAPDVRVRFDISASVINGPYLYATVHEIEIVTGCGVRVWLPAEIVSDEMTLDGVDRHLLVEWLRDSAEAQEDR